MKTYYLLVKKYNYSLDHNLPVVALESTIIFIGMPYPQNVQMAKTAEQIIRDNGAKNSQQQSLTRWMASLRLG